MDIQAEWMQSQISTSTSMTSFFDTTSRYNILKDIVAGDWADDDMRNEAREKLRSLAGLSENNTSNLSTI